MWCTLQSYKMVVLGVFQKHVLLCCKQVIMYSVESIFCFFIFSDFFPLCVHKPGSSVSTVARPQTANRQMGFGSW